MPKTALDDIIVKIKAESRQEVLSGLRPKLEKLRAQCDELLSSLTGKAPRKRRGRRGRPRKAARATAGRKAAAPKKARGRRTGKKLPAGTLVNAIRKALGGAKEALTLAEIRNELKKTATFKKHNPTTLYAQIVQNIQNMKDVKKSGKTYTVASATPK